jgi:PAS domain S-box-containing protein
LKPGPARILIVDDERHNRQLLQVMLAQEGFDIQSVGSGKDALDLVARQPPDLMLLDIMMPGMDGYMVVESIKQNASTKNIPVIIVTDLDDRDTRMRALQTGAEDFLTKPVDRAELCLRVRNLLRLKEHGDYHDQYSQMLEGEVGSRTAKLIESERLYRSTFDTAPVGIVHLGLDGRWLQVNQRMCDLLKYQREELRAIQIRDLMEPEAAAAEAELFRQMVAGTLDRHVVDELRLRRQDGGFVWTRVNTSVHRDAEGRAQHVISVIEDVTERRTLDAQLRQASKMDAIGQLASGVAHDFNNLLTVILGFAEIVTADPDMVGRHGKDLSEIVLAT